MGGLRRRWIARKKNTRLEAVLPARLSPTFQHRSPGLAPRERAPTRMRLRRPESSRPKARTTSGILRSHRASIILESPGWILSDVVRGTLGVVRDGCFRRLLKEVNVGQGQGQDGAAAPAEIAIEGMRLLTLDDVERFPTVGLFR